MDYITCHLTEDPVSFRERVPGLDIPREIEDVVRRLLRKKPEERYSSGATLGRALVEAWTRAAARNALSKNLPAALTMPVFAGASAGQVIVRDATLPPPPPGGARRRWLFYLGAGLLLGAAAAFGLWSTAPTPPVLSSLEVVVEPPDASLLLNGAPLSGPSPFVAKDLSPGVYKLSSEAPGYEPSAQEITLAEGVSRSLEIRLTPMKPLGASLSVTVIPKEAQLSLDGGTAEQASLIRSELNPGTHQISIVLPGYVPVSHDATLEAGQKLLLSFWMVPETFTLKVSSQPRGAEVTLTDLSEPETEPKVVGKAPISLKKLRGDHRYQLDFFRKGFMPARRTVALDPLQELSPQLSLSVDLDEEDPGAANASPQDKGRALSAARSLLSIVDRDSSGSLSKSEAGYIPGLEFGKADSDKDGSLSAQEIASFGPKAWGVGSDKRKSAAAVSRMLQVSLARKLADISACGEFGKLSVDLLIGPDGSVQGAKAKPKGAKAKEASACIEEILNSLLLLPPGRTIEATYELRDR
jgi:hypothetical protein